MHSNILSGQLYYYQRQSHYRPASLMNTNSRILSKIPTNKLQQELKESCAWKVAGSPVIQTWSDRHQPSIMVNHINRMKGKNPIIIISKEEEKIFDKALQNYFTKRFVRVLKHRYRENLPLHNKDYVCKAHSKHQTHW